MGVDIQLYPEWQFGESWLSICGSFRPLRNRELFQLMGLARGLPGEPPAHPLFPLRGLPSQIGTEAAGNAFIRVDGDWRLDYQITRAEAERMVANGETRWSDEKEYAVFDTDFFGHSWLTAAEYDHVLQSASEKCHDDWWGLQALLRELERRGHNTRIVLWFDE